MIYFKLLKVALKSQMEHRASFWMVTIAFFLSTFVEIFGIWILFDRFKMIQGWTFAELTLVYGTVHIGFSLAETFARGFDNFATILKQGEFDRMLLRPVGSLLQVASSQIHLIKLGRLVQGLLVLCWGISALEIQMYSFQYAVLGLALVGTTCLFYGLIILNATLAFWSTETLELVNMVTFGGVESGQYPLSIYPGGFRLFFTLVVPLACVAYYPLATLLQHETLPLWSAALLPLSGILFLIFCCQLWRLGVRHYSSTGS